MPSLEDMQSWSKDEIKAHMVDILPEDTRFHCVWDQPSERFHGWFEREGDVAWDQWGFDERMLLLDAFGWCWTQRQPAGNPDSPWAPRTGRVPMEQVTRKAVRMTDPEDVDPVEVLSVYEAHRKNH